MVEYALEDGNTIPSIGVGTHKIEESGASFQSAIGSALAEGYRLFDTAAGYGNEADLGNCLGTSRVDRSELKIITKIDDEDQLDVISAVEESLNKLKTSYIDYVLIHVPNSPRIRKLAEERGIPRQSAWMHINRIAWRGLEECVDKGYVRSIGVSNFSTHHIEALIPYARIFPTVNEIKMCFGSLSAQIGTLRYCGSHGIRVVGYSPFGHGFALQHPLLVRLGRKYNKKPAQILLRNLYQKGVVAIPRASSAEHLRCNLKIFDFQLDESEIEEIDSVLISERWGMIKDPDTDRRYNKL